MNSAKKRFIIDDGTRNFWNDRWTPAAAWLSAGCGNLENFGGLELLIGNRSGN